MIALVICDILMEKEVVEFETSRSNAEPHTQPESGRHGLR